MEQLSLPNISPSDWSVIMQEADTDPERMLDTKLRTPLHYAAERGSLEAVKVLLEDPVIDVDAEDSEGKKAADLALENNFYGVYSALQDA
jgi:Ankyrin repeats (many copies)